MTHDPQIKEHDELDLMLPFYVNGTLDTDEAARIDAALETNPKLAHSLSLLLEDQQQTLESADMDAVPVSMEARFFAQLDTEMDQARRQATRAQSNPSSGFLSALGRWLDETFTLLSPQRLGVAAVAAILVIAVQAGFIATLIDTTPSDNGGTFETASGDPVTPVDSGPAVLVQFNNTADIAELRIFLEEIGARIIDGPVTGEFFKLRFTNIENRTAEDLMNSLKERTDLFTLILPSR